MKKIFLLLSLAVASSVGYSLTFTTKGDATSKYSTTDWMISKGSGNLTEKIAPKTTDGLELRSSFEFDVDNLSFANLILSNTCDIIIRNKKSLEFRAGMSFTTPGNNNGRNAIRIENSNITLGGSVKFNNWDHMKSLGRSSIELIDSKLKSGGNLMFTMPSAYMNARANYSGAEVIVTGDTLATFDGTISPDSILLKNKDITFRMAFNEKNGKIPCIQADKIKLGGVNIDINVKSELKKGVYPILITKSGDKFAGTPRKITFNGSDIKVGGSKTVSGKKITLREQAFLGTGSNTNDYVLAVE